MKKRILSLFLALFVLLAAMPFGAVMAEETATEIENNNSFAAEITLSEPDFPKTVTTFKTANNFPAEADTFRAMCSGEAKTTTVDWDPSVTAEPSAYASVDGGTTTIENGWAKFTEGAEKGTFTINIVLKSLVERDTNYIAVDVDAKGITSTTSKMSARFAMRTTTGEDMMYATAGQTYYFLPEATEENPNPELETRTMSSLGSTRKYYESTIYVYPGEKGTFYFPETMFIYDSTATQTNADNGKTTKPSWLNGIYGDFSKFMNEEWRLDHKDYKSNMLYFQFRSCIPANETIAFSNVRWVSNVNFPLDYNAEYVDNDFSDAENTSYTYWNGSNHTMNADNFEVTDGVWKHNITAEDWTDENITFRYGHTLNLGYPVNSAFEALQFDVDFSDISYAPQLQMTYNVKNTKVSSTVNVRRFVVANGDIYAVWENGSVETIAVANSEWAWVTLPKGFKGTVVIPFSSLRTMNVGGYTYNGETVDLFKTDDINDFSFTIDMRNIPYENKGKVVTYDNFGYLTTIKPVLEEGTVFSADAPVETDAKIAEEIDTIEAWVKIPEGTAAGTILANKYRIENTTSTDSIVLSMNASGNPVLYLSDGDGLAINFEVSDVDLRTDKWTHIAFVKNTETATVNCYINGLLQSSTEIPEGFAEVKPYHTLTIGHYIADELGTATFGGEISSLKLWSKALTSSEILSSAINEATAQDGLISAWTLSGDNGYTDIAGNYNLEVYDLYITSEDEAYAEYSAMPEDGYTFAVIPDTQIANQREAITGDSTAFSEMYDWMVANKEALNLKFAMGIGDITNKDDPLEYALAKQNFDKLTQAGIGWSVVGGNHDFAGGSVAPNNTTNMNAGFPASELATYACFGGFMEEGKMDNSYYYITVNETKYLILNLMCEPYNSVVEWGNQVCAKNKDCKIIVITHEYLTNDADFRTTGYCTWAERNNHGIQLWDKLVSRHENIIMAIGGHVSVPDIEYREDLGVNGNKVINVLVDGQALDWDNPAHSLLMLLKFSKDGSQVTFNYYSPSYGAYLDKNNQFTLDVGGVTSSEPIPDAHITDYSYAKYHSGEIIREYEWFKKESKYISTWSDTNPDQSTVTIDNFSWYNNMIKFSAPAEFNIDPSTVTEESAGTAYTTDRIGITFGSLPNVVNENQTAISFYVDLSGCEKTTSIKIAYNNGTASYQAAKGGKLYLVDNDGNVTEKEITSNWASVGLPAGYKGTVVVPFSSFCSDWGNGEFANAATMLSETQNNNAKVIMYIMEARPGYEYLFNNFTYLEEYENADLVTLRKGLMDAENGEDIDVNGDTYVDVRDIVRLKKVLADAFINN